jgi:formylglycine-generating enzyme required for sulfatase activity
MAKTSMNSVGRPLLIVLSILTFLLPTASAQQQTKINPIDGLSYVLVAPGTFLMGCSPDDTRCDPRQNPAHKVTITKGFWIGRTPVTQQAYKKVRAINPSDTIGDQFPVERVSWINARGYCEQIGMRLPTEAEWEYAARGGNPNAHYAPPNRIAWFMQRSQPNTGLRVHDVGQKQPNAYGIYDMLGGLEEWVADVFEPYDDSSVTDPKGPPTGKVHVQRGTPWEGTDENDEDAQEPVSVSYRSRSVDYFSNGFTTFRCAGDQ